MPVHIQIYTGARNARITDMTNAGKRGKTCRVLRFFGVEEYSDRVLVSPRTQDLAFGGIRQLLSQPDERADASDVTTDILGRLEGLDPATTTFGQVAELLASAVGAARLNGISDDWLSLGEDQPIRAIDVPKPELTAGNDKWLGWLDNKGVHLRDLTDRNNEPCECTHGQTSAQAYKLAAKVWSKVQAAGTMHAASEILSTAGCKLHYWCSVD